MDECTGIHCTCTEVPGVSWMNLLACIKLFHAWSHDAWALIALLSAILVLGLIYGLMLGFGTLIRITRVPRAQVKIMFLQMLAMC